MSARGRREVLLGLRKTSLKSLINTEGPESALHSLKSQGSSILDRANQLKDFVKSQKQRGHINNAKNVWVLAQQKLTEEQKLAESDLSNILNHLCESDLQGDVIASRDDFETILHQVRSLEVRRREDLRVLRGITHDFKSKGTLPAKMSVRELLEELAFARSELEGSVAATAKEINRLQAELDDLKAATSLRSGALAPLPSTSYSERALTLPPVPPPTSSPLPPMTTSRPSIPPMRHDSPSDDPKPEAVSATDNSTVEGDLEELPPPGEEDSSFVAPTPLPAALRNRYHTAAAPSTVGDLEGAMSVAAVFAATAREEIEAMLASYARTIPDIESTADAVRTAFTEIAERFDMRLANWRSSYDRYLQESGGATGTWSKTDHEAFLHWRKELSSGRAATLSDQTRMDQLRLLASMFPHRSPEDVAEHEAWWVGLKILQERRKEIQEAWKRSKEQFMDSTRKFLEGLVGEAAGQAERMQAVLRVEAKRDRLHRELTVMRGERFVRDQVKSGLESIAKDQRAQAQAKVQEQRRALSLRQKALLQQWAAQLAARRREEEEERRLAEEARAKELAAQAVINEQRVQYRKALQDQRREEEEARRVEEEARERERIKRLDRIRALVQVHVESDPNRVLQPTASTLAERAPESGQSGFRVNHGWATDDLLKDPKFRVALALHEKGLTSGQAALYARDVIANTKPNKLTRIDNLTSRQIDTLVEGRGIF